MFAGEWPVKAAGGKHRGDDCLLSSQPTCLCWLYQAMVKHFKVSAELGLPAHVFLLERDSAAFRSLVATVGTIASSGVSCQTPVGSYSALPLRWLPLQVLDLGSLEFEDEWRQDDVSFVRQTTYPQFDKYVPASFAKMAQKYIGPKVVYTGKRTAERPDICGTNMSGAHN